MANSTLSTVVVAPRSVPAWTLPAELATDIATLPVQAGQHRTLAARLSQAVPEVAMKLMYVYEGMVYRPGRLLDASGREIADRAIPWIKAQLARAQEGASTSSGARALYEALRSRGVVRTAYRITPLHFAGRGGSGATDVWQAVVHLEQEYPGPELPYTAADLDLYSEAPEVSQPPLGPPVYRLQDLQHVGEFVQRSAALHRAQHPDVLRRARERMVGVTDFNPDGVVSYVASEAEVWGLTVHPGPTRLQRWCQDWADSSAHATPMEQHWRFEVSERWPQCGCLSCSPPRKWQGERYCDAIPQWATRRAHTLPQSSKARIRNAAELAAWLSRFDARAGHPMAWYFHLLHGNRISGRFGERVIEALAQGELVLPARDLQVLQRWAQSPYGF